MFPWAKLRQSHRLIHGGFFEIFMLVAYLANIVCLALNDTYDVDSVSTYSRVLKFFDLFFCILYMVEIGVRAFAFGVAKLKHPLRALDLILVLVNFALIVAFFAGHPDANISLMSLRAGLRILRPFFIATDFPAIRIFVVSVTHAILKLTDVVLLYVLFLLWFGVAGVFQFGGQMRNRCVNDLWTVSQSSSYQHYDWILPLERPLNGSTSPDAWTTFNHTTNLTVLFGEFNLTGSLTLPPLTPQPTYAFNCSLKNTMFPNGTTANVSVCNTAGVTPTDQQLDAIERQKWTPAVSHLIRQLIASNANTPQPLTILSFLCGADPFVDPQSPLFGDTTSFDELEDPFILMLIATLYKIEHPPKRPTWTKSISVSKSFSETEEFWTTAAPSTPQPSTIAPTSAPLTFAPLPQNESYPVPYPQFSDLNSTSQELILHILHFYPIGPRVSCAPEQSCDILIKPGDVFHGYTCPYGFSCQKAENPYSGWVNFDNLGYSLLTLFTSVTFQLWYEAMWWLVDSTDAMAYIYFSLVIVVGAFMIINLTTVVLTVEFDKARAAERERLANQLTQDGVTEENDEVDSGKSALVRVVERALKKKKMIQEANARLTAMEIAAKEKAKLHPHHHHHQDATPPPTTTANAATPAAGQSDAQQLTTQPAGVAAQAETSPKDPSEQQPAAPEGTAEDPATSQPESEKKKRKKLTNWRIVLQKLRDSGVEETSFKYRFYRARQVIQQKVVETNWFFYSNVLIILVNTGILLSDRYDIPESTQNIYDTLNVIFTIYFTAEIVLRFCSDEISVFVRNRFNLFDLVIVILSWLDITLDEVKLPIIRAFRILRLVKLLKAFPSLYEWIQFIVSAMKTSPVLVLMLVVMMTIMSCIGMQLLGGRMCGLESDGNSAWDILVTKNFSGVLYQGPLIFNGTLLVANHSGVAVNNSNGTYRGGIYPVYEMVHVQPPSEPTCAGLPRSNFDSFGDGLITSFVFLTSDNWNTIMCNAMTVAGGAISIFFVGFFYLGNYILLNIFIAILLSANAERNQDPVEIAKEELRRKLEEAKKASEQQEEEEDDEAKKERELLEGKGEEDDDRSSVVSSAASAEGVNKEDLDYFVLKTGKIQQKSTSTIILEKFFKLYDRSKVWAKKLVQHQATQVVMGLVILFGSFCESLEDPTAAPDVALNRTLEDIDIAITIIYCVELLINVHAYGLLRRRTSYLRRDGWNVFDFLLVVISIVGVSVADLRGSPFVRTVKVARALRPLRLIKRSPGMRLVLSALAGSAPIMKNVVVVTVMILVIYGAVGVQIYKGQMRVCFVGIQEIDGISKDDCLKLGGKWLNNGPNFDDILQAILALFQVATLEGWSDLMYKGMDTVAVDQPMRRNASPASALYFMLIAAFTGLFLTNVFIAVLIDAYNAEKRKASLQRSLLTTREQDAWLLTNKRIASQLPLGQKVDEDDEEGEGVAGTKSLASRMQAHMETQVLGFRTKLRILVRSKPFLRVSQLLTIFNIVAMAIEHYPEDDQVTQAINILNTIFAVVFAAEAAFKIFAESFRGYFNSKWNRVDFFVAVISILMVIGDATEAYNPRSFSLFRALRVLRMAQITRGVFTVDKLVAKFGAASLSLGHVFAVLVIVYFIFSVTGLKMFGKVKWQVYGAGGTGLDWHNNFNGLGNAFLLLTRVMNGGNWADLMWSCAVFPPFCDPNIGECGPASPIPQVFFVVFVSISMFVMRNLLTAVLLDSFSSSGTSRAISKLHSIYFYQKWKTFDPKEALKISPFDVLNFIRSLPKNCLLGFTGRPKRRRIAMELQFLTSLKIKSLKHRIPIATIVDCLAAQTYIVTMPPGGSFQDELNKSKESLMTMFSSPLLDNLKDFGGGVASFTSASLRQLRQMPTLLDKIGDLASPLLQTRHEASEHDPGSQPKTDSKTKRSTEDSQTTGEKSEEETKEKEKGKGKGKAKDKKGKTAAPVPITNESTKPSRTEGTADEPSSPTSPRRVASSSAPGSPAIGPAPSILSNSSITSNDALSGSLVFSSTTTRLEDGVFKADGPTTVVGEDGIEHSTEDTELEVHMKYAALLMINQAMVRFLKRLREKKKRARDLALGIIDPAKTAAEGKKKKKTGLAILSSAFEAKPIQEERQTPEDEANETSQRPDTNNQARATGDSAATQGQTQPQSSSSLYVPPTLQGSVAPAQTQSKTPAPDKVEPQPRADASSVERALFASPRQPPVASAASKQMTAAPANAPQPQQVPEPPANRAQKQTVAQTPRSEPAASSGDVVTPNAFNRKPFSPGSSIGNDTSAAATGAKLFGSGGGELLSPGKFGFTPSVGPHSPSSPSGELTAAAGNVLPPITPPAGNASMSPTRQVFRSHLYSFANALYNYSMSAERLNGAFLAATGPAQAASISACWKVSELDSTDRTLLSEIIEELLRFLVPFTANLVERINEALEQQSTLLGDRVASSIRGALPTNSKVVTVHHLSMLLQTLESEIIANEKRLRQVFNIPLHVIAAPLPRPGTASVQSLTFDPSTWKTQLSILPRANPAPTNSISPNPEATPAPAGRISQASGGNPWNEWTSKSLRIFSVRFPMLARWILSTTATVFKDDIERLLIPELFTVAAEGNQSERPSIVSLEGLRRCRAAVALAVDTWGSFAKNTDLLKCAVPINVAPTSPGSADGAADPRAPVTFYTVLQQIVKVADLRSQVSDADLATENAWDSDSLGAGAEQRSPDRLVAGLGSLDELTPKVWLEALRRLKTRIHSPTDADFSADWTASKTDSSALDLDEPSVAALFKWMRAFAAGGSAVSGSPDYVASQGSRESAGSVADELMDTSTTSTGLPTQTTTASESRRPPPDASGGVKPSTSLLSIGNLQHAARGRTLAVLLEELTAFAKALADERWKWMLRWYLVPQTIGLLHTKAPALHFELEKSWTLHWGSPILKEVQGRLVVQRSLNEYQRQRGAALQIQIQRRILSGVVKMDSSTNGLYGTPGASVPPTFLRTFPVSTKEHRMRLHYLAVAAANLTASATALLRILTVVDKEPQAEPIAAIPPLSNFTELLKLQNDVKSRIPSLWSPAADFSISAWTDGMDVLGSPRTDTKNGSSDFSTAAVDQQQSRSFSSPRYSAERADRSESGSPGTRQSPKVINRSDTMALVQNIVEGTALVTKQTKAKYGYWCHDELLRKGLLSLLWRQVKARLLLAKAAAAPSRSEGPAVTVEPEPPALSFEVQLALTPDATVLTIRRELRPLPGTSGSDAARWVEVRVDIGTAVAKVSPSSDKETRLQVSVTSLSGMSVQGDFASFASGSTLFSAQTSPGGLAFNQSNPASGSSGPVPSASRGGWLWNAVAWPKKWRSRRAVPDSAGHGHREPFTEDTEMQYPPLAAKPATEQGATLQDSPFEKNTVAGVEELYFCLEFESKSDCETFGGTCERIRCFLKEDGEMIVL